MQGSLSHGTIPRYNNKFSESVWLPPRSEKIAFSAYIFKTGPHQTDGRLASKPRSCARTQAQGGNVEVFESPAGPRRGRGWACVWRRVGQGVRGAMYLVERSAKPTVSALRAQGTRLLGRVAR
jgi:hypothetical protein